jgi:predicted nucleic acid-binding protein
VTRFVIDSSIAVKWFVAEADSSDAVALRQCELAAPDLLVAECTNVLWKKVRRGELTVEVATLAARVLARVDIELVPMRALIPEALRLAVAYGHPAYDCIYLALAGATSVPFVSADGVMVRKLAALAPSVGAPSVVSLADAAARLKSR